MSSINVPITETATHCGVCRECKAFVIGKPIILVSDYKILRKGGYGTRCVGMECANGHLFYVGPTTTGLKPGKVVFLEAEAPTAEVPTPR